MGDAFETHCVSRVVFLAPRSIDLGPDASVTGQDRSTQLDGSVWIVDARVNVECRPMATNSQFRSTLHVMLGILPVVASAGLSSPSASADDTRILALGRHLARECSACHRHDGVDNGIPSITGWAKEDFIATMEFYRSGARNNAVMVSVTQSLSEDEVEALARYYGSLTKVTRGR